jgi:hypothetical protein
MKNPGRALLMTAALLALMAAAAQLGDFTPTILTGSDRSMDQYESFRIHVQRDGPHDLIVFGNSVARQAVDTPRLRRLLAEEFGRPVLAYNFGAGGTMPPMLPYIVKLAYGVDQPRFCVVVLTPRMAAAWSSGVEERSRTLRESPYGVALHDPIRWRGALRRWLLDHVAIFALRYSAKDVILGNQLDRREPAGYSDNFGYRISTHWDRRDARRLLRLSQRMKVWPVSDEKRQVLVDTVRLLQSYGAQVWLAQAPTHPQRIALMPDPAVNLRTARGIMSSVAAETGAQALLLPEGLAFPASEFVDTVHLNAAGAAKYTDWLAESLARSGKLNIEPR